MTQYDDTNRGQIWGNDKKEKDTQPDLKGSVNVDGKEYWVSAWKRKPDANPKAPALSFRLQSKDEAHNQGMAGASQAAQPASDDLADDIPF
jgi:hypothetical protein